MAGTLGAGGFDQVFLAGSAALVVLAVSQAAVGVVTIAIGATTIYTTAVA